MSDATNSYSVEAGDLKLAAVVSEHHVQFLDTNSAPVVEDGARLRSFNGRTADGEAIPIYVQEGDDEHDYVVYVKGEAVRVRLVTPRDERLLALRKNTRAAGGGGQIISAPMPGLLKAMVVSEGDIVERGTSLCILEAMKMENEIKSPARLLVKRLIARGGTAVEKGAPLVELAPVPEG